MSLAKLWLEPAEFPWSTLKIKEKGLGVDIGGGWAGEES